jgi:pyruvate carboxylase
VPYLYGMRHGEEQVITLGRGITLIAKLQAISEPDAKGERTVMCLLNGQLRPLRVRDLSVTAEVEAAERADSSQPGQVAAPFAGAVSVTVAEGDVVAVGDQVATIEAMKMEAAINAPVAGVVQRIVVRRTRQVEGGDLLLVLTPPPSS